EARAKRERSQAPAGAHSRRFRGRRAARAAGAQARRLRALSREGRDPRGDAGGVRWIGVGRRHLGLQAPALRRAGGARAGPRGGIPGPLRRCLREDRGGGGRRGDEGRGPRLRDEGQPRPPVRHRGAGPRRGA
ncbi:MAG: hypothetical protein AVDCRST_MAG05-2716, partial [uncultured Rubrobacteraceae bacterium]